MHLSQSSWFALTESFSVLESCPTTIVAPKVCEPLDYKLEVTANAAGMFKLNKKDKNGS